MSIFDVEYVKVPGLKTECDYNRYNSDHAGEATHLACYDSREAACCSDDTCRQWAQDVVLGRLEEV